MFENKKYYYGIDFLRWFAAFMIVLYHYSLHFKINEIDYSNFLNYLIINREFAPNFVWLFWGISGFIFTNVYINKDVTFKKFFISRFARLYPLHLITLILVAILQFQSFKNFGHTQENYINDIYHFVLHLFFASEWGFQKGWSYNTPVWSVSIEIPVYFFFLISLVYLKKLKMIFSILISVTFYLIFPEIFKFFETFKNISFTSWQKLAIFHFSTCIFYFFLGSSIYFLCSKFIKYKSIIFYFALILILISVYLLNIEDNMNYTKLFPSTFCLILSLILLFANLNNFFDNFFKKIYLISNTSYSIYLIHFPLQILLLDIVKKYSLNMNIFSNLTYFFIFIIILQFISYLSLIFVETPIRKYINKLNRI